MFIISGTTDFNIPENTVVTIGKFDGIHNGHIYILERMRKYIARGYKLCVMTFDMPPASLGFGGDKGTLMTNAEKRLTFAELDIDYYVEFPFYEKTASISAQQFIEEFIVDRMHAKAVVVGDDCTFGQGAKGNGQMLRDFGPIYDYEVEIISKIKVGERELSSTYLRELASKGEVDKISECAFRPYFITGKFRRDPVNVGTGIQYYVMDVPEEKILPLDGVYYTKAIYEDDYFPAISNVNNERRIVETYIYGGVRGIARGQVTVAFIAYKREELKYYKIADLKKKIKMDIFEAQKWHKEHP